MITSDALVIDISLVLRPHIGRRNMKTELQEFFLNFSAMFIMILGEFDIGNGTRTRFIWDRIQAW